MLHLSSRLALLIGLALVLQLPAQAQQKQLTMEDAFLNRALQPQNLRQLSWLPGSNDEYSYVLPASQPGVTETLVRGRVGAAPERVQTVPQLSDLDRRSGGGASIISPFPEYHWISPTSFVTIGSGAVTEWDQKSNKSQLVFRHSSSAENSDFHSSYTRVAYTKAQNLYISLAGRENEAVTQETNPAIVNGQAAHRSEFGITKGTFWSPQGRKLAFYRMDQTMVTDYPLVTVLPTPAQATPIKYPMAGDKSHEVTVGVYDVDSRKTVFLQTGEPREQYLTNLSWSPDEKLIYVAVLNRGQNAMQLRQYDAATGAFIKTLFEEKDDKYVEPQHPLQFVPGHPDQFVWQSQRDGYNHLYLYSTSGKLLRQLTKGSFVVTDLLGFDAKGKEAIFTATAENGLERQIQAVSMSGGKIRRISQGAGTHTGTLSPSGKYVLDNFSSSTTPRIIRTISVADGKAGPALLTAPNPLEGYALGQTKLVTVPAADGQTTLNARVITPPNFDPAKKYPTVVYLYGGPHVQLVTNSWLSGSNLWMQLMAQKGYVVFSIDSRGSGNRGRAFEQATFRQLGTAEMQDQLKGVEYLKSLPYVDAARLGIHGWSFGGFMTTTMMTRSPGTFKVGVGGGPVIDWRMYEVMYTERYMDTPQENPEGYKTANLLNYADKLQGKLLLIHGTVDDVVVWQHSLDYLKKAIDQGIQLDYFVYPGHPHNVAGKDRVHLYNKITQYFDEHL